MPQQLTMMLHLVGMTWSRCEELLGEPIAIADPLITAVQADRLLELEPGQAFQLARAGWLERQPGRAVRRDYRLIDVLALLEPMTTEAAAELLVDQVDAPGNGLPMRRLDVILEQWKPRPQAADPPATAPRRRPSAWPQPVADPVPVDELLREYGLPPDDVAEPPAPRALIEPREVDPYRVELAIAADVSPDAVVDVKTAMGILGLGRQRVQNLVASGQLVADKDHRGRWQIKLASVIRLVNTRTAAAAFAVARRSGTPT